MKKLLLVLTVTTLTGCASQIMKDYVGQTIDIPMSDYGMPATAWDMPDGKRAFLWQMGQSSTYGGISTTTGSMNSWGTVTPSGTGANINSSGSIFAQTYNAPTFTTTSTCGYVLYAKRIHNMDSPASWEIVGFKKPRLECE